VTQRGRFVAYLAVVHAVFAAIGVALLLSRPYWLFLVEAAFALSLVTGIVLVRSLFRTVGFAREGAQLMRDGDFTSRLRETGQPEVDELVRLYNTMADNLRDERTRLQEQQHFLGQILRVSPSAVVILDFDRRITSVNPAAERLLACPAPAMAGRPLGEVPSPLSGALASIPPGGTEVLSLNGGRRVRCHHGTFIDRGFPRSFLLAEELTEELRRAERNAYERLVRVMAHEVNNSVTATNSLLQSCLTYAPELSDVNRPDFEQAMGIVIRRTAELNRFMRRFGEVFRLPPPARQPERVVPLLETAVRLLSARSEAALIVWTWDVDDRDLSVSLDRGQMDQAFLNVLQNAVEAIRGPGTVTIRVRARNGRPAVVVEDTGCGIAREAQANLFTPFFSTKPRGEGIGLTLVREILSGHGFDYSLEQHPGEPTRFTMVF
jgi:nitrogen fixation/metabolism regulation signal transduction histidine kinase